MIRNMSIRSKIVLTIGMLCISLIAAGNLQAAQNPDIGLTATPAALSGNTVTALPDGALLVLGGMDNSGRVQATAKLQDLTTASASVLPAALNHPRTWHTATVLPDGTVLVLGGIGRDGKVVSMP